MNHKEKAEELMVGMTIENFIEDKKDTTTRIAKALSEVAIATERRVRREILESREK